MGLKLVAALSLIGLSTAFWELFHTSPIKTAVVEKNSPFLACSLVKEYTQKFLKNHYSIKAFNAEISQRTYQHFFQQLDPGKNFFLQSDIDSFHSEEEKLGSLIKRSDCSFIEKVNTVFLKRVNAAEIMVNEVLQKSFDFNKEESIEIDRKKMLWAKDNTELKERWRKLLKFAALGIQQNETKVTNLNNRLKHRYASLQRTAVERTIDDVNALFLNAFASSLDPHSQYMMPEDQDTFHMHFNLELVGIGALLTQQDGYTIVDSIMPGGTADKNRKLKKGDKIIAIDSGDGKGFTEVVDMEINHVIQHIRGEKGTKVKLNVVHKGSTDTIECIELERDLIKLSESEAKSDVMLINGKRIGVINLSSFYINYQGRKENKADYRSSALDMAREIKKLNAQNIDGLLIDLRRNLGGDLEECIRITGLFIDQGPVVQVRNREDHVESLNDENKGAIYQGPLAVLISRQSASASEIFAGALQDYGRGLVLGNPKTYGKATVQEVIDLPGENRVSNGAMTITIAKFYRPSGRSNQEKGVLSDVVIPDILEAVDISEGENDFALPYDTIPAQKYFHPLQNLNTILPKIQNKSRARIELSPEFRTLKIKIQETSAEQKKTSFSLKINPSKKPNHSEEKSNENLSNVVIQKDDIQLNEAGRILLDATQELGKTNWVTQ